MTTQQVADRFMDLINQGKNLEIHEELFAEDVVIKESEDAPQPITKGKQASIDGLKAWYASVEEIHDNSKTQVIVCGDFFALGMMVDLTMKEAGRMKMEEICLYRVKNGKIVSAQYFY